MPVVSNLPVPGRRFLEHIEDIQRLNGDGCCKDVVDTEHQKNRKAGTFKGLRVKYTCHGEHTLWKTEIQAHRPVRLFTTVHDRDEPRQCNPASPECGFQIVIVDT